MQVVEIWIDESRFNIHSLLFRKFVYLIHDFLIIRNAIIIPVTRIQQYFDITSSSRSIICSVKVGIILFAPMLDVELLDIN